MRTIMKLLTVLGGGGGATAPTDPLVDGNASGGTADSLTPTITWTRAVDDPADGSVTYTVTASLNGSPVSLDNAATINDTTYTVDPTTGTVLALSDSPYTFTVTRDGSAASVSVTANLNLASVGVTRRYSARGTLFQDSAGTTPAVADGDPVGRNNDSVAGTNNATQATSGAKPTLKLNIINGLPVLRFDGGDYLDIAGLALFQNIASATVMVLARPTDITATRYFFWASTSAALNASRSALRVTTTAYDTLGRRQDADSPVTSSGGTSSTNWVVLTVVNNYTGGSQQIRVNGAQVDSDAYAGSGNTDNTASQAIREGVIGNAGSAFMIGDRLELLVWTPSPTTAVRDAVETYLAALVA